MSGNTGPRRKASATKGKSLDSQSDRDSPPSTTQREQEETRRISAPEPEEALLSLPQDARASGTLLLSHLWGEESPETVEKRDIAVKSSSSSDSKNEMIEENVDGFLKLLQFPSSLMQTETPEPMFPREMMPDIFLVYGSTDTV